MGKKVMLAVAGAGKTYHICHAIDKEKRNLILAYTHENIDNIEKIANFFAGQNNVKVKVEERIPCPVCDYPMRILEEHDDHYQCYCADCKRDRVIQKNEED